MYQDQLVSSEAGFYPDFAGQFAANEVVQRSGQHSSRWFCIGTLQASNLRKIVKKAVDKDINGRYRRWLGTAEDWNNSKQDSN